MKPPPPPESFIRIDKAICNCSYSSMLKMLKHYQFPYHKSRRLSEIVPGRKITFSSYPGVVHSMDDFYVIQNDETQEELVITGIPLTVFNDELWMSTSANKVRRIFHIRNSTHEI